jgi:hypothetical protein
MACIIAPTAGKRATFLSRIIVLTETQRISMQFDADIRLAAAAGGAARYFADAAGLDELVVSQLQKATITVCEQQFKELRQPSDRLDVLVERLPNRIEVVVRHGTAENSRHGDETQTPLAGVDQVRRETNAGKDITTLIKFLREANSAR